MQLAAPSTTPPPWRPTMPGAHVPPRGLSTTLDLPVWDATPSPELQQLDDTLARLFRIDGIRERGGFRRDLLHEITTGWTKRFDDLEALRGAILAVAPHRARDLTEAVRTGRELLPVLTAADTPDATRAQLEDADRAIITARNAMSPVRWGVAADYRKEHWIRPGDVARSRMQQFDGNGDMRIERSEFEHARTVGEPVFVDPRTYRQTFSGWRLFTAADERGTRDGVAALAEIEAVVGRWDGDGDGWLTADELADFHARGDAQLLTEELLPSPGAMR